MAKLMTLCVIALLQLEASIISAKVPFDTKVTESNKAQLPVVQKHKALKCDKMKIGDPDFITKIRWYHNNQTLTIKDGTRHQSVSGSKGLELLIVNLQKSDNGQYTCFLDNESGRGIMEPYTLRVMYPHSKPVVKSSHTVVEVNQEFSLNCSLEDGGYPSANEFSWRQGDGRIFDQTTFNWTLSRHQPETFGVKCQAKRGVIHIESDVKNILIEAPVELEMLEPNPGPIIKDIDDHPISFNCAVSGSNVNSVQWRKDGKGISISNKKFTIRNFSEPGKYKYGQTISSRSQLTLHIPLRNDPMYKCDTLKGFKGNYSCHANGSVAGKKSLVDTEPIDFTINYIIIENKTTYVNVSRGNLNVTLSCPTCSNYQRDISNLKITWKFLKGHGQEQLPGNITSILNGNLFIKEIKDHHFGTYVCFMADLSSSSRGTVNLSSTEKPKGSLTLIAVVGTVGVSAVICLVILVIILKRKKILKCGQTYGLLPTNDPQDRNDTNLEEANGENVADKKETDRVELPPDYQMLIGEIKEILKTEYQGKLNWMKPLLSRNVYGWEKLYTRMKQIAKGTIKKILILNANNTGTSTLSNKFCYEWANNPDDENLKYQILYRLNIPDDNFDLKEEPVEYLLDVAHVKQMDLKVQTGLKKYICENSKQVCFILDRVGTSANKDKLQKVLEYFKDFNVILSVQHMHESQDTNASYAEIVQLGQLDVQIQKEYIDEYLGKYKAKSNRIKNLLFSRGHDHIVDEFLLDPDRLLLTCFLLDRTLVQEPTVLIKTDHYENVQPTERIKHSHDDGGNLPTFFLDEKNVLSSQTKILERIVVEILKCNSIVDSDIKSLKKIIGDKKQEVTKLFRDIISDQHGEDRITNKVQEEVQPACMMSRSTLCGSFQDIQDIMWAYCAEIKPGELPDGYSAQRGMYLCGLSEKNAPYILENILKQSNGLINKQWMWCLQESGLSTKKELITILRNISDLCLDIKCQSTWGISELYCLFLEIFKDDVLNDRSFNTLASINLDINSTCLSTTPEELSKHEGGVLKEAIDFADAKKKCIPPLLMTLWTILKARACLEQFSYKLNISDQFPAKVEFKSSESCPPEILQFIFIPVECLFVKISIPDIKSKVEREKDKQELPLHDGGYCIQLPGTVRCAHLDINIGNTTEKLRWHKSQSTKIRGLVFSQKLTDKTRIIAGTGKLKGLRCLSLQGGGFGTEEIGLIKDINKLRVLVIGMSKEKAAQIKTVTVLIKSKIIDVVILLGEFEKNEMKTEVKEGHMWPPGKEYFPSIVTAPEPVGVNKGSRSVDLNDIVLMSFIEECKEHDSKHDGQQSKTTRINRLVILIMSIVNGIKLSNQPLNVFLWNKEKSLEEKLQEKGMTVENVYD